MGTIVPPTMNIINSEPELTQALTALSYCQRNTTLLVVRWAYERILHNGVKDTLNEVQSKF